jgi:hypothetical protein
MEVSRKDAKIANFFFASLREALSEEIMSRVDKKLVGLMIGRERDLPEALTTAINSHHDDLQVEMVKVGGTYLDEECPYSVIIDRMSHEIPYYRTYVKFAFLQGCYLINNPFTWSIDNKFLAAALAKRYGWRTPRTIVLPNKDVATDVVPDSFRNLKYPMDWEGIVQFIGTPAIFKDVKSGGRRFAHRVYSVEDLIQRYDESGTRTMLLQQVIESDQHVHCLVVGQEKTLLLPYSLSTNRYYDELVDPLGALGQQIVQAALSLTRFYHYEINMLEFVILDDQLYVISCTNPSPLIDQTLMTPKQFEWIVAEIAQLAVERARNPIPQLTPLGVEHS